MIHRGSRYEDAPYVRAPVRGGEVRSVFRRRRPAFAYEFRWYLVKAGDRYDKLAADAYGDATKWWVIADANPEVFYPDDLPLGAMIRIPYAAVL